VPVSFRVSDGPTAAPWLSPDIEPGQAQAGAFTAVAQLKTGDQYDFRVTVHNDGNEDAVPWTESAATGAFTGPVAGSGGLAWPLSGLGRTIATAPVGATRVQLVPQGSQYGLELQSLAGATIKVLASTLDPLFVDRRVVVTYSPNGRHVALLDYNKGSGTASVDIFVAIAGGGVAAGTQIMGTASVASYSAFLPNLSFVTQWNQTEFAGLNFAFVPEHQSLFLTWKISTADIQYAVLDLRAKPRYVNRVSIGNLVRQGVARHLFSPAGDVFAVIPSQLNDTVELFELPSGQALPITTNGYASGPLRLTALSGQLSVSNATAYGGIALSGISTNISSYTTIDPPFRSRCAVQVHLWITTPAGAGSETSPGNLKLPQSVNKQGASAYIARISAGLAAQAVIVSRYVAPVMMNAADHRCAFGEAYSVLDARPFQAKQRTGTAFLPLTWGQVGQRNLIVVGPNSPFFLVPYGLANDATQAVDVMLDLEQVDWGDLPPLAPIAKSPRAGALDVTGAGFIDFPCGLLVGRDQVEAAPTLRVTLAPGERRVVGVLIDVATEPDPARLDAAIFHVREQRSDGVQGGVTIIAASAPDLIGDVTDLEDPSACPVELAGRPVWTDVAAEGRRRYRSVPNYSEGFLVAEVRNMSTDPIDDLELWLESHVIPEARIEPLVFQALRLEAGATMRAAWPIELGAPPPGRYIASIVATSPRHAPHRLLAGVLTGGSRDVRRRDDTHR
jgi:hypothetical protein